ncbi:MAG: hypothetical protein ACTHWZ_01560 [Peptoniphilaceae bacterium]
MSKLDSDEHIKIEVNEEDLKDIKLKKEATYEDMKEYVLKNMDLK